ncbi:MAG: hypothetical protein KF830_15945 [Planctomycetes bacterium]|nr:hypothetical protein [Planctomycetota bacterium]
MQSTEAAGIPSPRRRALVRALVPVYCVIIVVVPAAIAAAPAFVLPGEWTTLSVVMAPVLFGVACLLTCGLLSRITRRTLVAGRFPRDLGHAVYGPRRLYALCWTSVYYWPALYHCVLAMPRVKRWVFRLFGYRGSVEFTTYPDTWLRDLPLLHIGEGAYLSNKATVSPNMCLQDGSILVLPIQIGDRALVGHLTMVAPGVVIGEDSEIGVGCSIGVKVRIGDRTRVGHCVGIDHRARIGNQCDIGTRAYLGERVVVHDGIAVPPGSVVPSGAVLRSQEDVQSLGASRSVGVPRSRPTVSGPDRRTSGRPGR